MALELDLDIGLGNVPEDIEDPKIYSALLDIHNAIELLASQGAAAAIATLHADIATLQAELDAIQNLPYALVSVNATQSIPNTTVTAKVFGTVDYDDDSLWDAVNNKFVIPAAALIEVKANIDWNASSSGTRHLSPEVNGSVAAGLGLSLVAPAVSNTRQQTTGTLKVAANAELTVNVYQNSGGALDVLAAPHGSWFSVRVLRWL